MAENKVKYYIRIDDKYVESDMKNAEGKVSSAGSKIGGAITGTALAVGTGLAAATAAAVTFGTQFETSMAKASTLIDTTAVDMGGLESSILSLSDKTGVAAADLGNTMYNALSAGVKLGEGGADMMAFLEQNAKLAKSGFTDVDTAVTTTAKVMNAYKMSVEDTDRIHKVLMQTQNNGITTVGELGASLAQVTPTAAAMGVSFDQVGAALATMTAQGTPTAQATTQLNSLFAELGKQGTNAQVALEAAATGTQYAGMSFQQMMEAGVPLNEVLGMMGVSAEMSDKSLLDMFGSLEAGKAALAMTGANAEQFSTNLSAMSTEADVVGDAFDKVSGTSAEKFSRMLNQLKNMAIELFATLEPFISALLPALGGLMQMLGPIISEVVTKGVKPLIESFTGFLPQLSDLIGKLLPIAVDLFSALLEPLMLLAEAAMPVLIDMLGALEPIFAFLVDTLLPQFIGFWESIFETLKPVIDDILPQLFEAFTSLMEPLGSMIEAVLPALLDLWNALVPTLEMIQSDILPALIDLFQQILEPLFAMLQEVLPLLISGFTQLIEPLQEMLSAILPPLIGIFEALIEPLISLVESILPPLMDLFQALIDLVLGIMDVISPLIEIFLYLVNIVLSAVMPIITALASTLTGVLSGAFASIITYVGNVLSVFGNMIDFIKNVFTGNWAAAWENIKNIFAAIADSIGAAFKAPINYMIDLINGFIGGLNSIRIPKWVPGFGGMSFDIPLIPRLKKGMDFVPSDFFPAYLDYGERVLTKEENAAYSAVGGAHGMERAMSIGARSEPRFDLTDDLMLQALGRLGDGFKELASSQRNGALPPIDLQVTGVIDGERLFNMQHRISLDRGLEITGGKFDYDRK